MKKFLLFLGCMVTILAMAQNPGINYQAVVRNAQNELVANQQNINVQIMLRNGMANSGDFGDTQYGAPVYSENHVVSTNRNGLMSLIIGQGTNSTGDFGAITWNNAYITTVITIPGEAAFTRTVPLLAVPYALYAEDVNNEVIQNYLTENHYMNETQVGSAIHDSLVDFNIDLHRSNRMLNNQTTDETTNEGLIVRTYAPVAVLSKKAMVNGNVTNNGTLPIIARGFCWNTFGDPTITSAHVDCAVGDGDFHSIISQLTPGTTYYFRAYATNAEGTVYGNAISFATGICSYEIHEYIDGNETGYITVSDASHSVDWRYNPSNAFSSFNENSDYENANSCSNYFTSYGGQVKFTWHLINADENSNISFTIQNNDQEIIYQGYSSQIQEGEFFATSCHCDDSIFTCGTSTVHDYDENEYQTVAIGSQCWMKQNMRSTHFADGTSVRESNMLSTNHSYYTYPDNDAINQDMYGLLYNWTAAMHGAASNDNDMSGVQGICPDGWHVPSRIEWAGLEMTLSRNSNYDCVVGRDTHSFAKALAATTGWNTSTNSCAPGNNLAMNNATGFSAMPAGKFPQAASSSMFGLYAFFWSATSSTQDQSKILTYILNYDTLAPVMTDFSKDFFYSVRCVRGDVGGLTGGDANVSSLSVSTGNLSDVQNNAIVCYGNITNDGGSAITHRGFCYGNFEDISLQNNDILIAEENNYGNFYAGQYYEQIYNLSANTMYYVRAFAINATDTAYGEIKTFTTPSQTDFTCGSSTVNDVDGNNYNTVQLGTQCWLKENMKSTHYSDGTAITFGSTNTSSAQGYYYYPNNIQSNMSEYGLLYNYRALAHGAVVTEDDTTLVQGICPIGWHVPSNAELQTMLTYVSSNSSFLCNNSSANIGKALASLTGWNTSTATCSPGNSPSSNNTTGFGLQPAGMFESGSISEFGSYAELSTVTTDDDNFKAYYLYSGGLYLVSINYSFDKAASVRCIRDNGINSSVSDRVELPTINTTPASELSQSHVVTGGAIVSTGNSDIIRRGVCWSNTENPSVDANTDVPCGIGNGTFTATLTGNFIPDTIYYVRAYAQNDAGIVYGNQVSFVVPLTAIVPDTTQSTLPAVELDSIRDITNNSAECEGRITFAGNSPVTAYGFCWSSTSVEPTLSDAHSTNSTNVVVLSDILSNLNRNTQYHVRAYATNASGTSYSSTKNFTTGVCAFLLDLSGGSDGWQGATLTAIEGSHTQVFTLENDYANESFNSFGGTVNFVWRHSDDQEADESARFAISRNYDDNAGDVVIFDCDPQAVYSNLHTDTLFRTNCAANPTSVLSCGTTPVYDYDGNLYHTVRIGSQCWMKENLKATHYSNGVTIPYAGTSTASYRYPNNNEQNKFAYGLLYNWQAAMNGQSSSSATAIVQGACPSGWHVPTYREFSSLISYMYLHPTYYCNNHAQYIAKALAANTGWQSSTVSCSPGNDQSSNNESGFSALPAGFVYASGLAANYYSSLYLWNTSMVNQSSGCYFTMSNASPTVSNYSANDVTSYPTSSYLSVRCIYGDTIAVNASAPALSIVSISDVTCNSATVTCNVSSDGGAAISSRGLYYDTTDPIVSGTFVSNQGQIGTYTIHLTNLMSNTTYHVRAYAANTVGGMTSLEQTFTTSAPVLPTANIFSAQTYYDGTLWVDYTTTSGGTTYTHSGICWSTTNTTPTTSDEKYDAGSSPTSRYIIQNLLPNTTYYIRAYATNSLGTGYSSVKSVKSFGSCSVHSVNSNEIGSGTVIRAIKDYDSHIYPVIKIGTQCWMAQNLRTTHYADGTALTLQNMNTLSSSQKYYYYPMGNNNYVSMYGLLYNLSAVLNGASATNDNPSGVRGICPTGWHVPSKAEFQHVINNAQNRADMMSSKEYWTSSQTYHSPGYNQSLNNGSGFNAIPSGYINNAGCQALNNKAHYWTTSKDGNYKYILEIISSGASPSLYPGTLSEIGNSVRCIRDIDAPNIKVNSVDYQTSSVAYLELYISHNGGANCRIESAYVIYSLMGGSNNSEVVLENRQDVEGNPNRVLSPCRLSNLLPGRVYRIVAYADNGYFVSHSEPYMLTVPLVGCISSSLASSESGTVIQSGVYVVNSVRDYDNNSYGTVEIGTQCWMKENLRSTHFSNGASIAYGGTQTSNTTRYYYYPDSSYANVASYGLLYNWPATMGGSAATNAEPSNVQGICPVGWHLPSAAEWNTLQNYMEAQSIYPCSGGISASLSALPSYWNSSTKSCAPGNPNSGRANISGFSAKPAGVELGNSFGDRAVFFTTSLSQGVQKVFEIDYNKPDPMCYIGSYYWRAQSVRCVRNDN